MYFEHLQDMKTKKKNMIVNYIRLTRLCNNMYLYMVAKLAFFRKRWHFPCICSKRLFRTASLRPFLQAPKIYILSRKKRKYLYPCKPLFFIFHGHVKEMIVYFHASFKHVKSPLKSETLLSDKKNDPSAFFWY